MINHLGNVLATITDRKVPNVSGTYFTYYNPQITTITDYYPFGMQIDERSWVANSSSYRFGFNGQEKENDISGNDGDYLSFTYRIHDVRLGRFLSVDPLAASYPWNSTYAFAENRVIDGIDLEGLEYVSKHHYADGTTTKTEIYKMTAKEVKKLGGTTAGVHNSVHYGPLGKGVVHYYYNSNGNIENTLWDVRQTGGTSDIEYHGLYSGSGYVTYDGGSESKNYDFSFQPIDYADAIAKRHDQDYEAATGTGYPSAGFIEDIRTLQADKDMLRRIDELTRSSLNPLKSIKVEGIETPVRTSYSFERDFSVLGQSIMIDALATYKQWKVDNKYTNKDVFKDIGDKFRKAHPVAAKVIDQIPVPVPAK